VSARRAQPVTQVSITAPDGVGEADISLAECDGIAAIQITDSGWPAYYAEPQQ
jgi:hypothetical protein